MPKLQDTPNQKLLININVAMARINMDKKTLASRLGLSDQAIYSWMNDKSAKAIDRISIRKLSRLCKILHTSVDSLLDGVI